MSVNPVFAQSGYSNDTSSGYIILFILLALIVIIIKVMSAQIDIRSKRKRQGQS